MSPKQYLHHNNNFNCNNLLSNEFLTYQDRIQQNSLIWPIRLFFQMKFYPQWAIALSHDHTVNGTGPFFQQLFYNNKKAINIIKTVESTNPMFSYSRKYMADIYLKYLKDRRNFAKCYIELIEVKFK